jgi:hypothetical protein
MSQGNCIGRFTAGEMHRSFVGSRSLRVRLRFLRMTARSTSKATDRACPERSRRECPSHTGKSLGLKPAWVVELYAVLKRRSSTVLHASR